MNINLYSFFKRCSNFRGLSVSVLLIAFFTFFSARAQTSSNPAPYCAVTHSNASGNCSYTYGFDLNKVTLNTLSWTSPSCNSDAYVYDKANTTTLSMGATYTIKIENSPGSSYTICGGAWIDFNGDYTFQPSEMIGTPYLQYSGGTNTVWTYTFTVPCNAKSGTTRLRVRVGYNNVITSGQSCNSLSQTYGNTRDFDVSISPSTSPSANFVLPKDTVFVNSGTFFINSNQSGYSNHEWSTDESGSFEVVEKNSVNLSYVFTNTGTINVRLRSTNCVGTATVTKQVTVYNPTQAPTPKFIADQTVVKVTDVPNLDVYLYDLSTGGPDQWYWEYYSEDPDDYYLIYFYSGDYYDYSQNPTLLILDTCHLDIMLQVENIIGSNTLIKDDYIVVEYGGGSGGSATNNICQQKFSTLSKGVLYDEGGTGQYNTVNQTCGFLISPCNASAVEAVFNLMEIDGGGDKLTLYDGPDASYPQIASFTNVRSAPTKTFTATSGSMYVEFKLDQYNGYNWYPNQGFELEWNAISAGNVTPSANFTIKGSSNDSIYSCPGGTTVYFGSTSKGGNPLTYKYQWIFDYNPNVTYPQGFSNSTAANPSFTYTTDKTYNVRLVFESCAGFDTVVRTFVLATPADKPKVVFEADETILTPGQSTWLRDNSVASCGGTWTITPNTYAVTGGSLTGNEVQLKFNSAGRFNVTRTVTNANGSSTETRYDYIKVVQYCLPTSIIQTSDAGISHVKFGSIDNASSATSPYTDFSYLGAEEFAAGKTYTVTVERPSNNDPVDRYIWVDWNRDGKFDATEKVASELNSHTTVMYATITVPNYKNLVPGASRMRIMTTMTGFGDDPCGPVYIGEYEDYAIDIVLDDVPPVITMLGPDPIVMEIGNSYVDSGAIAMDNVQGDITSDMKTSNLVDTSQPGVYYVIYEVEDNSGNKAATVSRTVIVKADLTAPVINIAGGNTIYHEVNNAFVAPIPTITDNPGNNIISSYNLVGNVNTNVLGKYQVVYEATDAYGNSAQQILTVEVGDTTRPVIMATGSEQVQLGSTFVDPTTVEDNYWPSSSIQFNASGTVNTNVPGETQITYTAMDMSGNVAQSITRKYMVSDFIKPVIITAPGTESIIADVNDPNFTEPAVSATDNYGSASVTRVGDYDITKLGTYSIEYTAEDAFGNTTTWIRTITVVDRKAPTCLGDLIEVRRWSTFDLMTSGAINVTDNYYASSDFIPTPKNNCQVIIISNTVNVLEEGLYKVQYQAIDGSGNSSSPCISFVQVRQAAGLENNDFSGSISVYPNPSAGKFTISFGRATGSNLQVRVLNILGEEVAAFGATEVINGELQVNLEHLVSGVYQLKISDDNNEAVKRITLSK